MTSPTMPSLTTMAAPHRRVVTIATAALVGASLLVGAATIGAPAAHATTAAPAPTPTPKPVVTAPVYPVTSTPWGGFKNGKIPTTALAKTYGGQYLRPDAVRAYNTLNKYFTARFHKPLAIVEGYRGVNRQQKLWVERYTPHVAKPGTFWSGRYWTIKKNVSVAAVPGTSVHGWGLAADFGSGVADPTSAEKKWLDVSGPKVGWYPKGNSFGEAWHYEFAPLPKTAAK